MSTEIRNGGAAFAAADEIIFQEGMSLRDYFAAAALTGAWAVEEKFPTFGNMYEPTYRGVATRAYLMADAMLVEREKKGGAA